MPQQPVRRKLRLPMGQRKSMVVLTHPKRQAKPSKAVTKYVQKAIKSSQETKYWSQQLLQDGLLDAPIHTPWTSSSTPSDIFPLTPSLTEGTSEYNRVGRKVRPVRSYIDIVATFPQVVPGQEVEATLPQSDEIFVTMYIVKSRVFKNWGLYSQSASQPWNSLLDSGSDTTGSVPFGYQVTPNPPGSPFLVTDTSLLGLPVNKEHYTLVKKKVIKLVRNVGMMRADGTNGNSPNFPQSVWRGRFYYRLPTLIYDDTKTSEQYLVNFPTNNNTMFMIGYCHADNKPSYTAFSGDIQPENNRLSISARVHCWFKDA